MPSSHNTLGDLWFGETALTEQDVLYRYLCRSVLRAQAAITSPPSNGRAQERERVINALIQINRVPRLLSAWSQDLAAWIDLPNPPALQRSGPWQASALCLERRSWWDLFASCLISHSQRRVFDPHLLPALFAFAQGSSCHPDVSVENGTPRLSICPFASLASQEECTCTLWNEHWGALYRAGAAYANTRPEGEGDTLEKTLDLLADYDTAVSVEGSAP